VVGLRFKLAFRDWSGVFILTAFMVPLAVVGAGVEGDTAGAKARVICSFLLARLKPCPPRSLSYGVLSVGVKGFDYGIVEFGADLFDCLIGAVGPGAVG
jgi:hypothetical protein